MEADVPLALCQRAHGGSVRNCICRRPGGGWLLCPPEVRGVAHGHRPLTGDFCDACGSASMIRTGTCLTCTNCGTSNGGCS